MSVDPTHKQQIVARFSGQAGVYERHAVLQKQVVQCLARLLPVLDRPDVLEIGCGTGLLTRLLLDKYREGRFAITDLSPDMLESCARNHGGNPALSFALMDGEHPPKEHAFDLIASSMTLQWFEAPQKGLARLQKRLRPGGHLLYATIGPDLFPQWRSVLRQLDLPCGLIEMPALPGILFEEKIPMRFGSGPAFLTHMRVTGAAQPRTGYTPLPPGLLRRALRLFEAEMNASADWHIVYGHLRGAA